jgi:hypothetical protein
VRGLLSTVVAIALLLVAGRADADDEVPRGQLIALLPLAADAKLSIYGQPVASEVARQLELQGFAVVVVTSTAPVPSKARLVIDGRIVRGDGDTVKIEARVRDPAVGKVVSELSATAPSLTRIDQAAAELAKGLGPILEQGMKAQEEEKRESGRGTGTGKGTGSEGGGGATRVDPPKEDKRPRAQVTMFSAVQLRQDDPMLEPLLKAGGYRLAGLVGHRGQDGTERADLLIHIELLSMDYRDRGVTTARARARVEVVDATGTVFSRTVRTDTLVGGRGDRRDAVARAAIDQIVDIAMPRVREQLAARKAEK